LVWVSEMFPEVGRGRALTTLPIATCFGQFTSATCVWVISDWKFSAAISLLPLPIVMLITYIGYWPESVTEVDDNDDDTKERRRSNSSNTFFRGTTRMMVDRNNKEDETSSLISKQQTVNKWSSEDMMEPKRSLFSEDSLRLRIFLCCSIFILNVLGGAAAVVTYGSSMIEVCLRQRVIAWNISLYYYYYYYYPFTVV
jgi:hypothetical protein